MATHIDIIANGYAKLIDSGLSGSGTSAKTTKKFMKASGSCCLIRAGGNNILFDTLGPWERDLLVETLESFKIHTDDINYLVCSHSHADHIGNLNLFTKAKKHFVGTLVYTGDTYDLNCFEPTGNYKYNSPRCSHEVDVINYESYKLDNNVVVEATQGHTPECVSIVATNCESFGTVGLVGDLFENEDDVKDETIWLIAGSHNPDLQRANRTRIFNMVDYIIPGHGPMFKTGTNLTF